MVLAQLEEVVRGLICRFPPDSGVAVLHQQQLFRQQRVTRGPTARKGLTCLVLRWASTLRVSATGVYRRDLCGMQEHRMFHEAFT